MKLYITIRKIIRPILFFLLPRKVFHGDALPKDGPVILCANHISLMDPVLLGLSYNRPIRFIAKKEACDTPILGAFYKKLGAFPVDREGKDIKAIRTCMSVLKEENVLGIFPEGTRILGGKVSQAKPGVALIAKRAKATLVLAHICPKKSRVLPFVMNYIYFSDPISYDDLCGGLDYQQASQKIMDTIYSLGE